MKYLLLIALLFAIIWYMRGGRAAHQERAGRAPGRGPGSATPLPPPQDMVECPVCRVHLPRTEALPGPGGQLYCCAEHRQRAGG